MNRTKTAAFALACTTACGLLTPEDLSEPRRSDIVTGFVNGPGIEVCFGDQQVVSPARAKNGPMALCLAPGAAARSCDADAACSTGERCVCGQCITRPCRTATECEGKEVCQSNRCAAACTRNTDCRSREVCSSGGCARPCSSEGDCAFGETCSAFDGTCAVKLCSATVTCSNDHVCVEQQRIADVREPHLMSVDGELVGFAEVREQGATSPGCAVYRMRVDGPHRWVVAPLAPVLAPLPQDGDCLGGPSVLFEGGTWVMLAARGDGSGIVRARSDDGFTFARDPAPVLAPMETWEAGWVGSPSIARWKGLSIIAYEGGQGAGLGLARLGEDGIVNRLSPLPWLTPSHFEDPVLWRHIDRVGSPFAVEHDGALLVYLTVRGVEGSDATAASGEVYPAEANDSIGLAATRDGVGVERFVAGPVWARRTNLRAYLGEAEPSMLFRADGAWLVYAASDASGQQRTGFGLATANR